MHINTTLAKKLISSQFSQWVDLKINSVEFSGHDNRTFRLGDEMLIRLPSAEIYAAKVAIEQKWLPQLAPHLSLKIPQPVALGKPTTDYPYPWSIYRWIEGDSANNLMIDDLTLQKIASQLAAFLNELHKVDITDSPMPGAHNFFRGAHPKFYDSEARSAIKKLENFIDFGAAISLWEKSLNSEWKKNPIWIHGDLSSGNILIKNDQLTAVIDFGGMAIGDPACDLVIAWTFFKNKSRKIFKENLQLDHETWNRARAWALWKASLELEKISDKKNPPATKQLEIINDILNENENF